MMKNTRISRIINFETIDSTNQYLLDNYNNLDDSTLVISNNQSKGRGRKDHNWLSYGDNIYMSLLLKPNKVIDKPYLLTQIVGLSLSKALDNLYSINTYIKWPNDIILNDKKIAGILVESKYTSKLECIVIGVGINVNQLDFNNLELINASSLLKETCKQLDKDLIINEFINNFYELFNEYLDNGFNKFVSEINNKLYILNKEIYVTNNPSTFGICNGINENGELIVKTNTSNILLNSNEVSIRLK